MEIYADYGFYRDTFMGTSIPEADFGSYALRASAFLNYITAGRIAEPCPDAVRLAVADVFQKDDERGRKTDGMDVKSVNNDGYSVTFASEGTDGESAQIVTRRKAYQEAAMYLSGTGLLSRCVYAKKRSCHHC